jgi:hypothetical protein
MVIGNPVAAIHGGITSSFLETTAIVGVARERHRYPPKSHRPDHQLSPLRQRRRQLCECLHRQTSLPHRRFPGAGQGNDDTDRNGVRTFQVEAGSRPNEMTIPRAFVASSAS